MRERMEDDYNDLTTVDEDLVNEFIDSAKSYVDYVERLIATK
jgi:hemerythrin-like domain-containing protein